MGFAGSMINGRKTYSIFFVLVLVILAMPISRSLLSSGNERLFPVDLSNIPSEPDFVMVSQDENREKLTGQTASLSIATMEKALTSSLTSTSKSTAKARPLYGAQRMPLTLSNLATNLPKFDNSFRNPCWYDRYNGVTTLRCFPYFYLAGFPKCSTTDLYHRLMAHPLVIAGTRKGTHYFSRSYFNTTLKKCSSNFDCASVTFSNNYFTRAAHMISMTNDTKFINSTFLKTGDGSPSISWDYHNFRLITENQGYDFPRNFSADWIRKIYPDTKIIMILREPTQRAFSDYMMYLQKYTNLPTAEYFHSQVKQTIQQIEECLESRKPKLLCTTYTYSVRLQPGMYYFYIRAWLEKFPREQILFLKYEEYIADMPTTLAKAFQFLGLPPVSQEGLEFMSKSEVLNASKFKDKQMLEKTKALLTNFYKPFNEKLAKLLGDDRFLWNSN